MLKNVISSVYYYKFIIDILLNINYHTFLSFLYFRMARYLTQKQIDEFRECFSLYDKKKQNKVHHITIIYHPLSISHYFFFDIIQIGVRDVITVMRSLGTYPTKKEIESHLKTYDKKQGDDIEFSTFLSIM